MHGTEQRPLRATAAPVRSPQSRPSTALEETQRGGSAEGHPPVFAPRGRTLSLSGDRTVSSSLALSSDTASVSPEASTPTIDDAAVATAARPSREVPPPLWWSDGSCLLAEDAAAAAPTPTVRLSASPSAVPAEWRCSIDFSHEIESRAEAELQQLWTALWCATHSEAALQTALTGPQTQWNPYRPTRGGQEVREEVLNSEVAEFKAMVPTDSLYLQGTAIAKPDSRAVNRQATATTSPHRPTQRSKEMRAKESIEEVLAMDQSGAHLCPVVAPHTGTASAAAASSAVDARYTEAWWAAHRTDAATALFLYVWEAVVVPFYSEKPASSFPLPFSQLGLGMAAASTSLTLTPAEEKDASGVVTAFWPTREDKRSWAMESAPRSSSPSCSPSSLSEPGDAVNRASSPLTRTQRSGCGLPLHPAQDVDIVSDDSIEVEVLDDRDETRAALLAEATHTPVRPQREHTAGPSPAKPARRLSRRQERPSTAGIQSTVLTPIEVVLLGTPSPVPLNGGTKATAKQRARSARTDEAPTQEGDRHAPSSSASQAGAGARVLRWAVTPTLHTTVVESLSEVKMDAPPPPPKPTSVARQRPPTAQPLVSRNKRAASPTSTARSGASSPPRGPTSAGAKSSGGPPTTANPSTTAAAKTRTATSAAEVRTGTASPDRRRAERGNALRLPRQLNSSANGSANRALRLLELRSRSTSRSPFVPRLASPISPGAAAAAAVTSGATTAEAPRKRRSRHGLLLDATVDTSGAKGVQRHGQLSPISVVPVHGRRRRHLYGSGHDSNNNSVNSSKPPPSQLEENGAGGPESLMAKARLAPLRETAAHSSTSQERFVVPETQRGTSALGRAPSVKSRQNGKGAGRSTSTERKKAAGQRPTTAQR